MAIKTSLTFVARAVSRAVAAAASAQNLTTDDFILSGSFDEDSEHISLLLYLTGGRGVDEKRLYVDTFTAIRRAFPRDPQISMYVGLVIRKVSSRDEYDLYQPSIGAADETDITYLLERP
ncbi:MAG: hypothetical protein U0835_06820 [Isosphaeraceae bacterium]